MKRKLELLTLVLLIVFIAVGCTSISAQPTATPIPYTATKPPSATPVLLTETSLPPTESPLLPTDVPEPTATLDPTVFELRSPAFGNEEPIPILYTCDDKDISPPLEWGDPPSGTQSLVLLADDLTAGGLVHWIFFNIPPDTRSLAEGVPAKGHFPDGSQQGTNNRLELGYMGPCPPPKTHRYSFRLHALDIMLDLKDGVMRIPLKQTMKGHILAETEYVGVYYP